MADQSVLELIGRELALQAQGELKKEQQVFLHLRSGASHEIEGIGLVTGSALAECGLASGLRLLVSLDALEAVSFGRPADYDLGALIA